VDSLLAELLEEDARIQDDLYASGFDPSPDTKKPDESYNKGDYSDTFEKSNGRTEFLKNEQQQQQHKRAGSNLKAPELKNSNFSFQPKESFHAFDKKQSLDPTESPVIRNGNPNAAKSGPGGYGGYAAEALLHDEKVKGNKLSGAFEQERDKAKSWEKAYYTLKEEAEKTNHKLIFSDKSREELELELAELKIDFGRAKVEIEELIRQLDIKDIKIDELQRGNKVLEQYNAQKERLLREHKNIFEKSYTNTALDQ
jgi:hypothetical protein